MMVHLVTDSRRLCTGSAREARHCLLQQVRCAIDAGVDVIQVREPHMAAGALHDLVAEIVAHTTAPTRVVVNDRLDVALAAGAHGVHLASRSFSPGAVRLVAPVGFLIGRSVHGLADLPAAAGADYLLAGTVWPSASKPAGHALLGEAGLSTLVAQSEVPVLAIGGVTLERAARVAQAGAAGVAAIGLFIDAADGWACGAVRLVERVAALRMRFDSRRSRS